MNNSQSGNVLFYILIAVALLASLSYAVTQSSRGKAGMISAEQAQLSATEIIEYANNIGNAVSQLRLRGYQDTEISFDNAIITGYVNPSCTSDECKVFHVSGGGISYLEPKSDWLDDIQSAQLRYGELYFHGESSAMDVGLNNDDLIMFIPYIKQDLCVAINKALGIEPTTDVVPSETNGPFAENVKFIGTYGSAFDRKVSGDGTTGQTTILYGKSSGCTEGSGTSPLPPVGTYHFYHVLIGR